MAVEPSEVKKLAEEELLKKLRGIVGVSVKHHSPKILRIYVERLDPAVLKQIPETFLGYKVEVIEVGIVKPLLTPKERQQRWRPIFPGISIGSDLVTAGTLTCFAVDNEDGEYVMLSNYHVFYGSVSQPILQPGLFDGSKKPDDIVGYLKRYVEIKPDPEKNTVDSAIASVEVDFIKEEPDLGAPARVRDPNEGETVIKAGRTTAVTSAEVIDDSALIKVHDYPGVGDVWFDDIVITNAFAEPGDSGSIAMGSDGSLVGQVFAGSDRITCLIKATNIVKALNITPLLGMPKRMGVGLGLALLSLPIVASIIQKRI